MNILVLGNGFDLAHNLPTGYKHFLQFTRVIQEQLKGDFSNVNWKGINPKIKEIINENTGNIAGNLYSQKEVWLGLLENNFWSAHFQNCYIKDGWIDFESEISKVVQEIDKGIHLKNKQGITTEYNIEFECVEVKYKEHIILTLEDKEHYIDEVFAKACDKLYKDLKKLTHALELYLINFVNKIEVDIKSPDIEELHPEKVLSFNYTDTYNKLYTPITNVEYDFIHGKAESMHNIETNNMVLGIDEYLSEDRKDKDIKFIAYKKYYQRIHKETGCLYKNWVDSIKQQKKKVPMGNPNYFTTTNNNLYIFGHSLDETDKDVLSDLILHDNVQTTIFYVNKEVYGQQIANLVKVIGQDELIRRTGGPSKTITFKQQRPMEKIN